MVLFPFCQVKAKGSKIINKDICIAAGKGKLCGTLSYEKKVKHPLLAILISGSGPTDRNGNNPLGGVNNSLKYLADSLNKHGFAVFRYDKRGLYASASAGLQEKDLTVDIYINDAIKWYDYFKKKNDYSGIGFMGHSEGAFIGLEAAIKTKSAFYVSLEGAAKPIGEVLKTQLKSSKMPDSVLKTVFKDLDSLKAGHLVKNVPKSLSSLLRQSIQLYMISWMKYNPAEDIKKLDVPILIVQGTTDLQVTTENGRLFKKAKPDAKLVVIKGMNHVLKDAPMNRKENFATYSKPNLPLAKGLTGALVDFLNKVSGKLKNTK